MASIIEHQNVLKIYWNFDCAHIGGSKYVHGPRGYSSTEDATKPHSPTDCVNLWVSFTGETSREVFDKIKHELSEHRQLNGVAGEIDVTPQFQDVKLMYGVTPEFAAEDAKRIEEQKRKDEEIYKLEEKLANLGVVIKDAVRNRYQTPQAWCSVLNMTCDIPKSRYMIQCRKGTKLYDILEKNGIFHNTKSS